MNKRVAAVLLTAVIMLAVIFFFLWQREQPKPSELEQLCQTSASAALDRFRQYNTSREEPLYWYGVAEFRSFMNAYLYLNDNISNPDYLYCNAVYGQMVLHPEAVTENLDGLIDALEYLAMDYTDPNGYHLMCILQNELMHGG